MTYVRSVRSTMKSESYPNSLEQSEERASLEWVVEGWEETCKNCNPLTPMTCVTSCKIWNLKNELRKSYEKMTRPDFMTKLLNALKNKRRLQIFEMISKGRYSKASLQQKLKKLGYHHSQQTIAEEYLAPLIHVRLVEENQNRYHATVFGCRLAESTKNFIDIEKVLPPHSKCYEETALGMLLNGPKTHKDFEGVIPTKSAARVLNRLQTAGLIETTKEKDYVFYFKTKRDPNNVKFSPTERRVYGNISIEGVSARKLAEKTMISLRRTYKYLRRLKGKKMVFTRMRPKSYVLTANGTRAALMLQEISNLIVEVLASATQFVKDKETHYLPTPDTSYIMQVEKRRK